MVVENRRRCLLRHIDTKSQRGLEVGPYYNPTVRKDEADVRYLDFYSTEDLIEQKAHHKPPGVEIAPVDYVVKSDEYYRYVPDQFDYVIANHVIEHVDNPVQWVVDLARLVHDGGVIFLTVPDKKYCFDRYRADTPLSHLLADYFRGHGDHQEHGVDIVLNYDSTYIGQAIDLDDRLTIEKMRSAFEEDTHPGRHNHVFQAETFVQTIVRPLQKMGLWPYTLLEFSGSAENNGEFFVVLRKTPEAVAMTPAEFYEPWSVRKSDEGAEGMTEDQLRALVGAREAELAELRASLAQSRSEVKALRESLSWKMTRPVRSIVRRFRGGTG